MSPWRPPIARSRPRPTPARVGPPPDLSAAIEAESGATLSEFPPSSSRTPSTSLAARAIAPSPPASIAKPRACTRRPSRRPHDRALHANRSAANLALGDIDAALRDAARAVAIDPNWPKAHYRLGRALADAGEWIRASAAFARCLELAPDDSAARERYEAAEYEASDLRARAAAQVAATRRDLASRLRDARRADARADAEARWRQTMRGPDWDASDLEWRPTYLPMMRARRADRRGFESDPRRAGMLRVAAAAAELDAPKRSLATLDDDARLEAYARAAARHCANRRALCLSAGNAGTLAMCAAAAGASTVVALERNRFLYRSAKLCLKANEDAGRVPRDVVRLRDATLDATRLEHLDDRPADVVLTDLIDHAGFGLGLLPAIDRVADAGLAVPDAVFAPSRVVVRAALLRLRVEDVAGSTFARSTRTGGTPRRRKWTFEGNRPARFSRTVRRVRGGPRGPEGSPEDGERSATSDRDDDEGSGSRDVGTRRDDSRSRDVRRSMERGRVLDRRGSRRRRRPRRVAGRSDAETKREGGETEDEAEVPRRERSLRPDDRRSSFPRRDVVHRRAVPRRSVDRRRRDDRASRSSGRAPGVLLVRPRPDAPPNGDDPVVALRHA